MDRRRHPAFPSTIAVIDSNDDLVRLIREALEDEGYTVVPAHVAAIKSGELDLKRYLAEHVPEAVVYDIAPPYADNWKFLQLLRNTPEFGELPLVVTTVNKRALDREVGRTDTFEVIGTRDNLAPVVSAINERVRARRERLRPRRLGSGSGYKRRQHKKC